MRNSSLRLFLALVFMVTVGDVSAQVGIGLTGSYELYTRHQNPSSFQPDNLMASRSAGSALSTFGLGPKIWIGVKKFSISVEGQAQLAPLAFSVSDAKGLGAVSFPIMGFLNFGGTSAFDNIGKPGVSVGGGLQYTRTELFGLSESFADQGVTRDFYKTYVIQLTLGGGLNGFAGGLYVRYGFNPDLDGASNIHIGVQTDFNFVMLSKIHKPESSL